MTPNERAIHGACIIVAMTCANIWPAWRGAFEGWAGAHIYALCFKEWT